MSTPDYLDKTKYNVQGGNEGDPVFIDPTIPSKLHTNSVVNRYLLFLHPEWNSILNPAFNPQRSSIETYYAGKGQAVRDKAIKWNLDLRERGLVYYSRTGKIIPIIEAEAHALSIKLAQEQIAITKGRAKKGDSVFSSFGPTVTLGETISNIIPSIPEAQAVITSDGITYGVAPGNHKEQAIIEAKSVPPLPTFLSISGITDKSVSITWDSWSSSRYIDFKITNWLYTLKNNDTGKTIKQQSINRQQSGIAETSLTQGTNYRAYLIAVNAFGNSNEQSIDFKTLGSAPVITTPIVTPTVIISAKVQDILTKLDNNVYTYPTWFKNNITWVRDGTITSNDFLNAFNNLLQNGTIIDKTISIPITYPVSDMGIIIPTSTIIPIIDESINEKMVSQSIGAFKLENGRLQGDIIYNAESDFNPYYYNKTITSVIQIKDQSGFTVKTKTNNLNFTATERDERISIDENVGDLNAVKIDFFVWLNMENPVAFSLKKYDEIVALEVGLSACPIGQHRNFNNKCVPNDPIIGSSLLGKVMGVTALLGTLALLGSRRR